MSAKEGDFKVHIANAPLEYLGTGTARSPRPFQTLAVYKDVCLGCLKNLICLLTAISWNVDEVLTAFPRCEV